MSETKSQPTPEVDAEIERRLRLRYHETPEKIPHVEASFARSLEISRDQWKTLAESLKDALIQCRYRLGEEDASVADYDQFDAALHEFNQLNSTTENK